MNNLFNYDSDGNIIPSHKPIRTFDDSKSEYMRARVYIGGKLKKKSDLTPEENKALTQYEEEKGRRKRLGI